MISPMGLMKLDSQLIKCKILDEMYQKLFQNLKKCLWFSLVSEQSIINIFQFQTLVLFL